MKKIFIAILLICSCSASALHIQCVGKAVQLTHQRDTLLLFESNPEIETLPTVGNVDWYRLPDTINPIAQSSHLDTYTGLEHGAGYMIKKDGVRDVFWVFDYDSLRPDVKQIDAELSCENTLLVLNGEVPAMKYQRMNTQLVTYPRTCHITYLSAAWDGESESWVDSIAVEEVEFENMMRVAASPMATDFAISDILARQLDLKEDTLYSPVFQPVALKAKPMTITTTRGKMSEPSNEVNRPYSPDDVMNMSAPLEVLFRANGLNANYYEWKIYKASQHILSRKDAEHRYTFTEKGNYRAVVVVSNDYCVLDSVDFTISISESMLLVPNVFTPNGDGANDEFRVAYRSIKEFHCWVYNRWGHLVYEWTDPAKGWDGTINGKPAAEGAYFYVIRALGTDADPNAQYIMKPAYKAKMKKNDESLLGVYQLSGSINLLRGGKKN